MWGLTGGRLFGPLGVDEKKHIYNTMIVRLQCAYFGSFPQKSLDLSEDVTSEELDGIEELVTKGGGRRRCRNTLAAYMCEEAVSFVDRLMKLDPRDRPASQELLHDQWLSSAVDYYLDWL